MSNHTTNSQKNAYLLPVAIVIAGVIIAGAVILTKSPQDGTKTPPPAGNTSPGSITINTEGHIRGNPDAPVTIVEYSDFQCPFCNRVHPTLLQILENYPDQVQWVYKHFPLDQIHSQARPAAEASECAAEQGKFWEFADGLFKNQAKLSESFYNELASQLGLNTSQFEDCVSSRQYKDQVEADYQEGMKAGVRGTPHSFINGERISGAVPYAEFKAAVDKALFNFE